MSLFFKLRALGIMLSLGGTLFVLGNTLLTTAPLDPVPMPVRFPAESPVAGWIPLMGEPDPTLPNTSRYRLPRGDFDIDLEMQFIPDLSVHYIRNTLLELHFLPRGHLPLDAAMQFYVNGRSRIITNLHNGTPVETLVESRAASPHAGYGFWEANQRLHLSTVVTPGGNASMITKQVARSIYMEQATGSRIGQWLIGRAPFPDRRCVLIHLSIPNEDKNGRQLLEKAWAEWQNAFRPVFPN